MLVFLFFLSMALACIYWRLHVTNGDFTPLEYDEQIVHYVQPRYGEDL